tara:strand:- start:638 stop:1048 length:411 start_codon:yes stop_codon:yes gene_type:complete
MLSPTTKIGILLRLVFLSLSLRIRYIILGLVTQKIEIINRSIGNDLGIFSNLKIRKNTDSNKRIEIDTLFIIEIISCNDAYLQIPRYNPRYFKRTILVNENKRRNSQSSFIKFDALARSSLTQSATKKDIPKKIKS